MEAVLLWVQIGWSFFKRMKGQLIQFKATGFALKLQLHYWYYLEKMKLFVVTKDNDTMQGKTFFWKFDFITLGWLSEVLGFFKLSIKAGINT